MSLFQDKVQALFVYVTNRIKQLSPLEKQWFRKMFRRFTRLRYRKFNREREALEKGIRDRQKLKRIRMSFQRKLVYGMLVYAFLLLLNFNRKSDMPEGAERVSKEFRSHIQETSPSTESSSFLYPLGVHSISRSPQSESQRNEGFEWLSPDLLPNAPQSSPSRLTNNPSKTIQLNLDSPRFNKLPSFPQDEDKSPGEVITIFGEEFVEKTNDDGQSYIVPLHETLDEYINFTKHRCKALFRLPEKNQLKEAVEQIFSR